MRRYPEMETRSFVQNVGIMAREMPRLSLPDYQRDLVWTPEQALRLVQSAWDGYPFGSVLLWEPRGLRDETLYVLDGQQRISALVGCRPGGGSGPSVGWHIDRQAWTTDVNESVVTLEWWHTTDPYDRVERLRTMEARYGRGRGTPIAALFCAMDRMDRVSMHVDILRGATPAQAAEAFRRLNVEGTPFEAVDVEAALEAIAG